MILLSSIFTGYMYVYVIVEIMLFIPFQPIYCEFKNSFAEWMATLRYKKNVCQIFICKYKKLNFNTLQKYSLRNHLY